MCYVKVSTLLSTYQRKAVLSWINRAYLKPWVHLDIALELALLRDLVPVPLSETCA